MARPPDEGAASPRTVDAWRFAGTTIRDILSRSIPDAPYAGPIPWTRLRQPLSESRVALLSSAGLSMRGDAPFDMDYERKHPTRGDGSWRRLPADARTGDVDANHLHIDTGYIERDLEVALPLEGLAGLAREGVVGEVAPSHYSIMGFQGSDPSRLVEESAPAIAASLRDERADILLLAPV
jgi:hypothetical protein